MHQGRPAYSGRAGQQSGRSIKDGCRIDREPDQPLKSSEPKPGSTIKRYERAIILSEAKERQKGHMNTSPT
jgi:hypothetical protein